ncbi:MAG TPA: DMT family transporter [Candidatus Eisenbacteria bacterium]|nr:DMT family transporter [Candidatus Eisenbacteria bacterium]
MLSRADLALLCVSAIWGTTFALLRDSLRVIHPAELMAVRFSVATLLLMVIFPRTVKLLRGPALGAGAWLGLWLTAGYFAQVMGLMTITASRSAFITSTYILFTPFLAIPLARAYPGLGELIGVVLGFTGILLFSADVGFSLKAGDLWTLGCALAFGIQIVVTNIVAKKHDPVALSVVQMAVAALAGWTVVAARGGFATPLEEVPWGVLIYLAVVATALVIALQTWALARTSPVKAAVLFSTEPIFAAIFAVAFFGEGMSTREVIGGAVILLGVIVTELWRPMLERVRAREEPRGAS